MSSCTAAPAVLKFPPHSKELHYLFYTWLYLQCTIGEDSVNTALNTVDETVERGLYLYVTVCIHTHTVVPFVLYIILSKSDLHVEKLQLSLAQGPRAAREVQAQRDMFE